MTMKTLRERLSGVRDRWPSEYFSKCFKKISFLNLISIDSNVEKLTVERIFDLLHTQQTHSCQLSTADPVWFQFFLLQTAAAAIIALTVIVIIVKHLLQQQQEYNHGHTCSQIRPRQHGQLQHPTWIRRGVSSGHAFLLPRRC